MTVVVSLVTQDNDAIVLSNTETTLIGRGFFQCNDKRVSKNHGEVTVEDKTIRIKSCSTNPIFYKMSGKDGPKEILRKDSEIVLGNLDVFSLLPSEFEFTVRIEDSSASASVFRVREINEINHNLEAGGMALSLSQLMRQDSTAAEPHTPNVPDQDIQAVSSTTIIISATSSSSSSSNRKRSLDELPEDGGGSSEHKKLKPNASSSESATAQPSSTSEEEQKPVLSTPVTQSVKSDPDSTDQSLANQELPSTSTGQSQATSNANAQLKAVKTESGEAGAASTTDNNSSSCQSNQNSAQSSTVRPSCEFGIRCYRLTDDHRREFAHPMDNDYRRPNFPVAEPGSPRCPYWDACYRRNPEHFRTLEHPSADQYTTQRPPQLLNIYHPANNYNVDESDDESEELSDFEDDFDDSDVDRDYEIDGSHSSYDDENNLEE